MAPLASTPSVESVRSRFPSLASGFAFCENAGGSQMPGCVIEAMKVFNEITATISGTVSEVVAESGALVQAGDVLIYVA